MKPITSLVSIAALNFVTSALAQEEETASPATEETPSTVIEETPTAAPEAKAATRYEEQPAAQKKEKTAAASAPVTTSPAPAGGRKMSVPAMLKDNENRWFAAIAKHDTATIESMLAVDFISVDPMGRVQNRDAMLAEAKNDKNTYISLKPEKLDVHMYGSGVAVVVGTANEKRVGKNGKPIELTYRLPTPGWIEAATGNASPASPWW
jgi:ketosteroid isomerase-like protein